MNVLAKTQRLELSVATSMQAVTADRIFDRGEAASGSSLGDYSDGYMKQRRKAGYTGSTKIILQGLERSPKGTKSNRNKRGTTKYNSTYPNHMALEWAVIPTKKSIGLGFKRQEEADKSEYVEATYDKPIFEHTKDELNTLQLILDKEVKKILNG